MSTLSTPLTLNFFLATYAWDFNALKRIISIFLVFLLLFNALGFYGLLKGLRYNSTRDLVARLNNNQYSQDETVTLKIPLAIPYQSNSQYERVDGEFTHEGNVYRLVKQKFDSDTLFVVCIKDKTSGHIEQALTDYVKTFTDNPAQGKDTSKLLVSIIKDFLATSLKYSSSTTGWSYALNQNRFFGLLIERPVSVLIQPPQA